MPRIPVRPPLASALLLAACAGGAAPPDPAALDPVAVRYVELVLGLGRHDASFVDAYYGPDSLQARADSAALEVPAIRAAAESLAAVLGDSVPAYADSLDRMRHRYLRTQLGAVIGRARMVEGERFSFDDEAGLLYDAEVPRLPEAHFDSLLARLDALLPGSGPLAARYTRFRDRTWIPAARVDTVFKAAIAECRARTAAHLALPAGERFDLEYVTGTPWNAYNWYQGGYRSLIQVNLDLPISVDRAVDLACHEGYPGHHVYNAMLEQALVNGRGWVEVSVYPLFSPQSFIAEGSANYGVLLAFPGAARAAFEREVLFPLAGLDPALAEPNAEVRVVMEALNHARNEVARRYLAGEVDSTGAARLLERWWLVTPEAAAKSVRFIDSYRSYVINYNLGRDLVQAWVERAGGDPAARWRRFGELLASPRLPGDLR